MEPSNLESSIKTQTQTFTTEQPKQNNFLVILLSVLLLISVSIAGFFAYQTKNLTNELGELKSNSISIPKATTSADPKMSWKSFESKKYEFVFKYPSELILDSPSQTDSFEDSGELNLYTMPNGPVSFSLSVISSKGTTLDGQIDMVQSYRWSEYSKSNIDIDGVTGVMYSGVLDKKQPTRIVIFSNSKYIFKFSTVVFDDGDMLNQILSTFKFKESVPTSDWKTYTNEKNGFTLRYPNTWFEVNGSLSTRYECSRLNFSSKTSNLSLSEFLSKEYNDIDYKTNMKPATSLIDGRESQTFGSQGIGEIKTVYIKDKTKIITINQTASVPEGGDPDKYWEKNCKQFDIETDEILSTLKFIN